MAPTLSIVTPSLNQGRFIEDNIKSVLDQNFNSVEHIVIDGGSSDNTIEILERYENEYDLKWVSEPDRGQTHAINKGIERSNGEWIGWQNADDYYLPGSFSSFDDISCRNPDLDVIYGDLKFVDKNGKEIEDVNYYTRPSKFIEYYLPHFTSNHTTFFKKEIIADTDLLNENLEYAMDVELFWRLLKGGYTIHHEPEFFAAHRDHEDAKTRKYNNLLKAEARKINDEEYDKSRIENMFPFELLRGIAVLIKLFYMVSEGELKKAKHEFGMKSSSILERL